MVTTDIRSETLARSVAALFVSTVGLASAGVFVADALASSSLVSHLFNAYSMLFSLILLGSAVWLFRSDDAPDRPLRVAGWCLAGTLLLLVAEWLVLVELTASFGADVTAVPAHASAHAAVIGGVAGFLLGVYDVENTQRYEEEATTRRRLESLLDSSLAPIVVLDAERRVERWNAAAEQLFGWTEAEVLGERPPIVPEGELEDPEECSSSNAVTRRTKTGERIEVCRSFAPVRSESERIGYFVVYEDVTDRNRQQRELERSRDLLLKTQEMANVGGWEVDLREDDLHWTEGTRAIFETSDDFEPTVETAIEFYRSDDQKQLRDAVDRCRQTGVPYDLELRVVTARGRERWVRTQGEAVMEGDTPVALRGTIQDVTEQKQREQQLTVLHRLFRHNIRNSLNVVMGRAQLLLEALDAAPSNGSVPSIRPTTEETTSSRRTEPTSSGIDARTASFRSLWYWFGSFSVADTRDHLRTIISQSEELVSIGDKTSTYDDVLVPGNQRQVPVAVRPILEQVRSEYRRQHSAARIEISCPESVSVHAAPRLLSMAVDELLQNALEHTEEVTPVVELAASVSTNDRVVLRVEDNGPGLSPYERNVVTAGDETPLIHSSGVGLWLVNWLVTRLGGTVRFTDNEPRGTVVLLELPAADRWE